MRKDCAPTKRMPMFLLMAICGVALFVAIMFYLYYSPGKTKLISPPATTSSCLPTRATNPRTVRT